MEVDKREYKCEHTQVGMEVEDLEELDCLADLGDQVGLLDLDRQAVLEVQQVLEVPEVHLVLLVRQEHRVGLVGQVGQVDPDGQVGLLAHRDLEDQEDP